MKVFKQVISLSLIFILSFSSCKAQYPDLEDGIYAEFVTTKGTMVAKLFYDKTPITVANFVSLAEGTNTMVDKEYKDKKFYNGTIFHRIKNNFMIQGGDPLGTGLGNPGYRFNDEFYADLKHNKPGMLSMANSGINSNGSQFFITENATPYLDNVHTVFGELLLGLDVLDSISNVKTDANDKPLDDVVLKELNIIRKGKDAKSFDAPKIFKNHFAEIERLAKEKAEKEKLILKATNDKFQKQKEKAIILPSGLQYIITEKGTEEAFKDTDKILMNYSVYFEDGKLLGTSKIETAEALDAVNQRQKAANGYKPIIAEIGPDAKLIPGLKEGIKQLHVGDKATLFIPYHLAYGDSGNRDVPPKTNIIFEVEILEILK
ncbi:peptidylprolyl isomerase [Confluentibacter sediminis]|uniref:peptidylprolyl isomerase n=1 Tax=Confluentibacter sediminis TaxID=2219045 RepID=UPI000DAD21F8|nr:peptidylprolyl isomerase [Confluentibacter sediminis]